MTSERIREYGNKILPYLVLSAKTKRTPTYKDLANLIGTHPRVMSKVLGYIRDDLCIPRGLPLITSIVVNQGSGLPGDDWLPQGTSHLSSEEYRQEFEKLRDEVFAYLGWDLLLKELGLPAEEETIDNLDERGRAYSEYLERISNSGENEDHQKLKEYIAQHPDVINVNPVNPAQVEYLFISGDRADIIFQTGQDAWAVVEIKNGEIGELVRGVYQAIKYRELLRAEKGHGEYCQVDAVLAAYDIPASVSSFAAKFNIRCRIIRREILKI
jgi:hypothetical protein